MKILAIADIKVNLDNIAVDHDLVLTLGDLSKFDLEGLERWSNVPKMGIHGNHDRDDYFEHYGIYDLHCKRVEFKGLVFGGIEGCNLYKNTSVEYQYSQEEVSTMLKNFPPVDVMVCHSPPFDINDHTDEPHIGFKGLKSYIDKRPPSHLFHGHTYPENPMTEYNEIKIHYVHGATNIEI